jgi:hypothetical protein
MQAKRGLMRQILCAVCVLTVFAVVGCRPLPTPVIPGSQPESLSPTPVPAVPQIAPTGTPILPMPKSATPPRVAASGIHLMASIGPTCPGPERPGQVCTRPYAGIFVVTNSVGDEVARAITDQDGQAKIDLPPGDYVIRLQVEGLWPSGAPTAVSVPAGQYVVVKVELDSGIR